MRAVVYARAERAFVWRATIVMLTSDGNGTVEIMRGISKTTV